MKLLDLQRSGFDRKGFFCIFALFVLVVAKRGGEGGEGGGIVVRRGGGGVALGLADEKKSEPGEKGRGRRRGVGSGEGEGEGEECSGRPVAERAERKGLLLRADCSLGRDSQAAYCDRIWWWPVQRPRLCCYRGVIEVTSEGGKRGRYPPISLPLSHPQPTRPPCPATQPSTRSS